MIAGFFLPSSLMTPNKGGIVESTRMFLLQMLLSLPFSFSQQTLELKFSRLSSDFVEATPFLFVIIVPTILIFCSKHQISSETDV